MPLITRSDLQNVKISKSFDGGFEKRASQILRESTLKFSAIMTYDIFLSHSYWDADEILKLKILIESLGHTVFVDWMEEELKDRNQVSVKTADKLKLAMNNSKCLFYAFSTNSKHSIWMPWELGYMDAKKNKVAVMPILEQNISTRSYKGSEYLGLYPYVQKAKDNKYTKDWLWVHRDADSYHRFDHWLKF